MLSCGKVGGSLAAEEPRVQLGPPHSTRLPVSGLDLV